MADQGGTEPERGQWSRQDRRTWVVTFGATLAANLATVLVLGGALAVLRWTRGRQPHHHLGASYWVAVAGLIVLGAGVLLVGRPAQGGVFDRWTDRSLWGIGALCLLTGILILIGAAAGIK
jgi:hypothetical protein